MCKYCDDGQEVSIWEEQVVDNSWITEYQTYRVWIEYGILRFVDVEDSGCLDHGEYLRLLSCPFCGRKFNCVTEGKVVKIRTIGTLVDFIASDGCENTKQNWNTRFTLSYDGKSLNLVRKRIPNVNVTKKDGKKTKKLKYPLEGYIVEY